LPHISTGDLFRAAIKNETELGKTVKSILAEGRLVPDDLTIALVKERLSLADAGKGWILDGFPRTVAQAEALQSLSPVDIVVNFEVKDELILFRLTGRRVCRNCGKIYHIATMAPKREGVCDVCGGELYVRSDDQEASIKTRLEAYREQTEPLIDWYAKLGRLVTIDGSGSPQSVYEKFAEVVEA
ncbi:MAG TPA: nucleoside monophosphate kinase, partial [Rectinemataceae bacterium]|nr:nucleoside monophosphate kinase [Rectinemataceae bacterium]